MWLDAMMQATGRHGDAMVRATQDFLRLSAKYCVVSQILCGHHRVWPSPDVRCFDSGIGGAPDE